jgi:hypothetical protein
VRGVCLPKLRELSLLDGLAVVDSRGTKSLEYSERSCEFSQC